MKKFKTVVLVVLDVVRVVMATVMGLMSIAGVVLSVSDFIADAVVYDLGYAARNCYWSLLVCSAFGLALFIFILFRLITKSEQYKLYVCDHKRATRSDHGSELSEVMEAIRGERFEYLALFDEDGYKLAEGTYSLPYTCTVTKEDAIYLYDTDTGLHNHPSGSAGHSENDIAFQLKYGIRRSIVVSLRQTYILENPFVDTEEWREDGEYPFSVSDVIKSYRRMDLLPSRWAMKRLAKKYGLKFYTERVHRKPKGALFKHQVQTRLLHACMSFVLALSLLPPLPAPSIVHHEKYIPEDTISVCVYSEDEYVVELPSRFVYYAWSDSVQTFCARYATEKTWRGDGPSEARLPGKIRDKVRADGGGDGELQRKDEVPLFNCAGEMDRGEVLPFD